VPLRPTRRLPSDRGLFAELKQDACLGIIEVNTNRDLDWPICFADSGHSSRSECSVREERWRRNGLANGATSAASSLGGAEPCSRR
jgi:hypothetical protein